MISGAQRLQVLQSQRVGCRDRLYWEQGVAPGDGTWIQIEPLEALGRERKKRASRSELPIRRKELKGLTGRGLPSLQKHLDRGHVQSTSQPLRELFNQNRQTDMRTQSPSKIGKRLSVVVSVLVEITVNLLLDSALERGKQEGYDQGCHGENEKAGLSGHPLHSLPDQESQAHIENHYCRTREQVGDTLLEEKIHVHEPVVCDCIGKG